MQPPKKPVKSIQDPPDRSESENHLAVIRPEQDRSPMPWPTLKSPLAKSKATEKVTSCDTGTPAISDLVRGNFFYPNVPKRVHFEYKFSPAESSRPRQIANVCMLSHLETMVNRPYKYPKNKNHYEKRTDENTLHVGVEFLEAVKPGRLDHDAQLMTQSNTPSAPNENVPRTPNISVESLNYSMSPISTCDLSKSNCLPVGAEPCFEYLIFQKIWAKGHDESDAPEMQLITRPYENIDEANAQAEILFKIARLQSIQFALVVPDEWNIKSDEFGCRSLLSTVSSGEFAATKSWIRIWVKRLRVSTFSAGKVETIQQSQFIWNAVFLLKLSKLVPIFSKSDEASESEFLKPDSQILRVRHQLPCEKCYTSVDGANRAAMAVQIVLSHGKNPNEPEKRWQESNSIELHKKVLELEKVEKCWKSEFNGLGLGGDRFELVVEKEMIVGPRNL